MIKIVGFDLDGTLVNSINAIAKGVNTALENNNLKTYSVEEYKNFIGGGLDNLTKKIIEKENYSIEFEKLSGDIKMYCLKYFLYKLEIYKDIDKLLDYLVENNILIAVITNKADHIAKENEKTILSKWKFSEFIGATEILKPNPTNINNIIKKYGIKKEEFLFVGDMIVDIETAKNANVDFIYCNWGFGKLKNEVIDENIKKVDSPLEIIEYIKKQND